ncbi:MAG: hypothetical protein EZS28_023159 [Streblomastix strix]|uniref:Uncharacterized protein n=1 Tax=Streblomastix strix TaxID=222440 RepID=A0A5J4VFP9_9EUKA|nr:MAG: hypothetical protein EZS28_023159 [Streblomastix strix]
MGITSSAEPALPEKKDEPAQKAQESAHAVYQGIAGLIHDIARNRTSKLVIKLWKVQEDSLVAVIDAQKGDVIETEWSLSGRIEHISKEVSFGNEDYNKERNHVALNLNMDSNPGTLTFFYNDVKQRNYIINIPPAVRFWAYLWNHGSSFKMNKFERLSEATAKHLEGKSQALTWGKIG